jgi:nucleotide-binding universal stress UspA family protein
MAQSSPTYVALAAVSFDATGAYALQEAARIAHLHEATQLHLVHVRASEAEQQTIPEELQARVQAVQSARPIRITAHIRAGDPARAILQTALELDADLIVVGTHQREGVERLVLGSVAEHVLRGAHCPVLVAMPKDYARASDSVEPVCPDCARVRRESSNQVFWCDRHRHSRVRPHVYEPGDSNRPGPLAM